MTDSIFSGPEVKQNITQEGAEEENSSEHGTWQAERVSFPHLRENMNPKGMHL